MPSYLHFAVQVALTWWVRSAVAEPMPQVTPAPTGVYGCSSIDLYSSICDSLTPGFTSLAFSYQAPCLCYDENFNFDPSFFDAPFSNCLGYIRTEDPLFYSSLLSDDGGSIVSQPCSYVGDVIASLYSTDPSITSSVSEVASLVASNTYPTSSVIAVTSIILISITPPTPSASMTSPTSTTTPAATTDSASTSTIHPLPGEAPGRMIQAGLGLGGLILALAVYL